MPIAGSTRGKSYARLNLMRLGATRLDYYQPWFKVKINGTDRTSKIRIEGCTITQNLDGLPDTASMRVSGFTPVKGQDVKIYMGDSDTAHCLIAGHILSVKTVYEGDLATNIAYDLQIIDYTWRLNDKRVIKQYTATSATAIVTDLLSTYASWATTVHVVAGLGTIDAITFTNDDLTDCLDRVAARIGAYWYFDYGGDLHFFLTDDAGPAQSVTDSGDRSWNGITMDVDLSQVRTRAIVRGGGANASTDVAVGTTTLPVTDGSWYSSSGGYVECGPQRITYTSKSTLDGHGCVTAGVPGSGPSTPSAAQSSGGVLGSYVSGNLTLGTYQYKITFVNASGETSASSAASGTIANVTKPGLIPNYTLGTGGSLTSSSTYFYWTTFVTSAGETDPATFAQNPTLGASDTKVTLLGIPTSTDGRVTSRKIYRSTAADGTVKKLVTTLADNTTTTYADTTADASLGVDAPTSNTAASGKIDLASIALGTSGTTSRTVYRTAVGGSTYKLQSTIADNTTTTLLDNTADGSLGATLGSSSIGASPGDTTLRITDLSAVPASGWVRVASQVLSYSGRSATSGEGDLTGIPSSGAGAITASISAGVTLTVEPHLTGIASSGAGSILYAITSGDAVNLRVERNDATAQSNLAGFLGTGDGIIEDFDPDGRIGITEAQNRGDATLAKLKDPLVKVSGTTRDQTVRPGRSITFTVTNPPISGTFKIQRVTLSEIAIGGAQSYVFPLRTAEATSTRFSFEDFVRQIKAARAA